MSVIDYVSDSEAEALAIQVIFGDSPSCCEDGICDEHMAIANIIRIAKDGARAEGWNAAVEACVEIADKDAAMDYTASMIRVQIMGLLITDKTCAFSTAKAEVTDMKSDTLLFQASDLMAFKAFCVERGWVETERLSPASNVTRIVTDLYMTKGKDSFCLCHAPNSLSPSPRGEKEQRKVANHLIKEYLELKYSSAKAATAKPE